MLFFFLEKLKPAHVYQNKRTSSKGKSPTNTKPSSSARSAPFLYRQDLIAASRRLRFLAIFLPIVRSGLRVPPTAATIISPASNPSSEVDCFPPQHGFIDMKRKRTMENVCLSNLNPRKSPPIDHRHQPTQRDQGNHHHHE